MFSSDDLTGMRTAQTAHMMDSCKLQACVQTTNSMGEEVETWPVDGDEISCGLDMRPGDERHGVDMSVLTYDARLRLAITQTPDAKDRVKITKRYGEALGTPLVYDIVGPIQRGPSGIRLLLKRVET